MSKIRLSLAALLLGALAALSQARAAGTEEVARGMALRNAGNLQLAIEHFSALRDGRDENEALAATGELGITLLQAHRHEEAAPLLRQVYDKAMGENRARYAIELGNLAAMQRRAQDALRFFAEARALSGRESDLYFIARINEARLADPGERPALLAEISPGLSRVSAPLARARMRLALGTLASDAGSMRTAYENLDEARVLAVQGKDARIEIEAFDGLAQLYEAQGRNTEALTLNRRGLERARAADGMHADILLRLEWRQGRLLAAQGAPDQARAAYQRAVEHIESIRQDIPIEYDGGQSSFRDTLEPIYLGYIDLLLKQADTLDSREQADLLRRARGIAELIKQSELQDYLGERCSVEAGQGSAWTRVGAGSAIFYPIVLKDRVEVIFESDAGITRHTAPVDAKALRQLVLSFARQLRGGEETYRKQAIQLYDILLKPFRKTMEEQGIATLQVVPDGVLRLLPWATLHDGKQFLVENYSVATLSGLSAAHSAAGRALEGTALLAGMAEAGPVVEKFWNRPSPQAAGTRSGLPVVRSLSGDTIRAVPSLAHRLDTDDASRLASLRKSLALPGVRAEIESLSSMMPGTSLLDSAFTAGRLHEEIGKGEFRLVHIATHGFFGSSGKQSYIMAYDDLVTMDGLRDLLKLEGIRKNPIELLTLSACETAEGDDRSPLGIAGTAIRAKAGSVLGTLWPVSDSAAQQLMTKFYGAMLHDGASKAEALRRAQIALINDREMEHPFYWGAFIIVGNWR